jgi:tricorn protease-like protein
VYALDNSTSLFKPIQYFHDLDAVYSIHMSADHKYLVIGGNSGIIVYTLASGTYRMTQRIDSSFVYSLSMTADGMELAAGTGMGVYVYSNVGVHSAST